MTSKLLRHIHVPGALRADAETLLMVVAMTVTALAVAPLIPVAAIDLLYLVPVMGSASLHGLRGGLLAAVASALAYNFFFTLPLHTLWIENPSQIVTVVVLLGVALFTGQITARLRVRTKMAAAQAAQNASLAAFAHRLIGAAGVDDLGQAICKGVADLFAVNAVLVVQHDKISDIVGSQPARVRLSYLDEQAVQCALVDNRPAGRGTDRLQAADWTFYPLIMPTGTVGALGLARDDGRTPVGLEDKALLASILAQAALALERQRLAGQMRDVDQLRERDRLRGALLSSVGHDLRTPLTAILTSSAELRRSSNEVDAELLDTLDAEARRLDRFIANLLDMARIEAGAIKLRIEPIDLIDAVSAAARDVRRGLEGHPLRIEVAADLPLVRLDPQLFHHCLINLLDNAARHGRPGTPITIAGERTADSMTLMVLDEGPGLPSGSEQRIFETFTRVDGSDRQGGSGLGLAIVQGFAQAMGIEVSASNRDHVRGAALCLRFPAALLISQKAEAAE